VSPNADWGYDVSDFCAVEPEFGTMDDVDRLIAEAGQRGIRVLMDIVPNHTSDQHPWFVDSRSSRTSAHRDWYVWADPKPDGSPPNNWVSSFGGPAWTLDETTGQSYLHNHLSEQPDLNWWNEEVRDAFDGSSSASGPTGAWPASASTCATSSSRTRAAGQPAGHRGRRLRGADVRAASVYNANRPEVHDVIRRWRTLADTYDEPRLLIGETPVPVDELAEYYGNGVRRAGLAFNFPSSARPFEAPAMRAIVEETEAALPPGAWPAWTGSNHDMFRFPTRWAEDDPAKVRLALLMLLSLRGTPVLYQGDEIGMATPRWPRRTCGTRSACATTRTTRARRRAHADAVERCPGGGFTEPGVRPWLPLGDVHASMLTNVEEPARTGDRTLATTPGICSPWSSTWRSDHVVGLGTDRARRVDRRHTVLHGKTYCGGHPLSRA
jgi:alpha-glucosidase